MAHASRLRTLLAALTRTCAAPAQAEAGDPVVAPGQVWILSYSRAEGQVTRALIVGPLVHKEGGMHFYEQELEGEEQDRLQEFWYDPYDSDTEFISVRQTLENYAADEEAIEECVVLKPGASRIGKVLAGRLSTAGEAPAQAFEAYILKGDTTGLERCTLKRVR